MRKLLICLSLILVLTLVFVGCKNNQADGTTTETPTTEAPTTGAPTTEVPTTDEPTTDEPTTDEPTTDACTHSYPDEWTVDESVAECAGENRLYRVCTACGEKETKADTCSFGEWTKVEGKLCADEDRLTKTCSKCGKTEKSADGECTFGDAVVTEPTCEDDGLSVITCTKCGNTNEEVIEALGHSVAEGTDWHIILAPTCTEEGVGFGHCVNCDEFVEAPLAALGHNANEATCTEASVCATCGVEVAPKAEHDTVTVEAKEPTCTETGLIAGSYCANCGSIDELVIPALGHDHKWVVTTLPTFTAEGVNTGTCACGDVQTMAVEKRVPSVLYTSSDLTSADKATLNNVVVTPGAADSEVPYITLTAQNAGASIKFLLSEGQKFTDVISIKYRVSADYVSFATNKDAYFNVNGQAFYASLSTKNIIDYDNVGTVGEWTLLNIDFRKTQITVDGVEYDMFDGAALEVIEYVLFNGFRDDLSIDISYVAFFDTVADAVEYAATQGEVATPVVFASTEKNYNTSLNNTNGAGEYGAPGKYLGETNNFGTTFVDWSGRFFNNYNLTVVGSITVEGGAQKLIYSLDGGFTWLEFAEGMATVNADGTYTAKFDLSAFEGKTVDLRIAAVLAVDGKTTEYATVLNLRKIRVEKGNFNSLDLNFLAVAGNQKNNITATVQGDYVHYSVSGAKPTITLFNDAEGLAVKKYMLIQFRGNGSGYGTNYDFYLTVNGQKNIGGKKYNANWFNMILDNTWNYIIVDLSNGGAIDVSTIKTLDWTLFDANAIGAANGDWLDIKAVEFFDTYDAAKAVANPNGNFISLDENGSTFTKFRYTGISADNIIAGPGRVPAFTYHLGAASDIILLDSVTLLSTDYKLNLQIMLNSNVAFPAENIGFQVGDYDVQWGATLGANGFYDFSWTLPTDFVNGREYTAKLFVKSATNSEVVFLNEFVLMRQPEGITLDNAKGAYDTNGSANISLAASAGSLDDVVALWKGDTLVMYYGAYSGVTGFKANGGANITVVDANLAKLTTEGTYTVKLHKGSVNGTVVASKEVRLMNSGIVSNARWTAQQLYTSWKNLGGAAWGFDAQIRNDGNGDYIRFTANANSGDGSRLFLLFTGVHSLNGGWNANAYAGNYVLMKYRNHSNSNQVNICYGTCGGCLAAGGNACGRGWIGTAANGWAVSVQDGWRVPAGHSMMIVRFAPGCVIDIESIAIVTGWQGVGGAYDTLYGMYSN